MTEKLSTGQRVHVKIDGKRVEGVFVRSGRLEVTADEATSGRARKRDIAWVRRSDTGEVEPVERDRVSEA